MGGCGAHGRTLGGRCETTQRGANRDKKGPFRQNTSVVWSRARCLTRTLRGGPWVSSEGSRRASHLDRESVLLDRVLAPKWSAPAWVDFQGESAFFNNPAGVSFPQQAGFVGYSVRSIERISDSHEVCAKVWSQSMGHALQRSGGQRGLSGCSQGGAPFCPGGQD